MIRMRVIAASAAALGCWAAGTASGKPLEDPLTYTGMCDASAAAPLGTSLFVAASDEDNILRVYHRNQAGPPTQTFNLNDFLKPQKKRPEVDIEGATQIGDLVYWISSHGRNYRGKKRSSRERFFATRFKLEGQRVRMEFVGQPYRTLLDDLLEAPQLAKYGFAAAAELAPKSPEAFNIESLAATPDGSILIGFRNPLYQGKAILIPMLNPSEVVEGKKARLGDAIELSMGGLGFRSMEYWPQRKKYFIVAGPIAKGTCRIYLWSGDAAENPREVPDVDLEGLAPEASIVYPEKNLDAVQILSDDGALPPCQNLPPGDPGSFRSGWVRVPGDAPSVSRKK